MKKIVLMFIVLAGFASGSCSDSNTVKDIKDSKNTISDSTAATEFVRLALQLGKHDKNYVDAYYGPEEYTAEAEAQTMSLDEIINSADSLTILIHNKPIESYNIMRREHLETMLKSLKHRAEFVNGKKMSFDEESKLIYDAVAVHKDYEYFDKIISELETVLPGQGALDTRFVEYRKKFIIPVEKLDAVFMAAVEESRKRTKKHIDLPENENFTVEYVKDVSWGAYNWYKGNGFSLIQVNTDMPIYIDRAVDLACHEGYPGHHVYHSLLDLKYYRDSNWVEYAIYPLFSPKSLLSEGTANFGISVVFSKAERMKFEKEVLFPLAGLNPDDVEEYYKILSMTQELDYAGNEAARDYLDGRISREEAVSKVMKYKLRSKDHAETNVDFYETYRAYLITYNLGQEMVKDYIESRGGTPDNPEKKWEEFIKVLSVPMMPSDLKSK